ncbi:MAG: bifunctional phosphoribosylaminoimidazolecarboxamide formyltransferase/IMP cyclohydrolase PurH, partial [Saprospiraceae bacterium]
RKKNRILLKLQYWPEQKWQFKNLLEGIIRQEKDNHVIEVQDLKCVTTATSNQEKLEDLVYATRIVKHLKSNAIAIVHHKQLIGMGCGQTSRVDALEQAIKKAHHFNFSARLPLSSMASEAFFPFPDCVEIADKEGVRSIAQPGGSVKDQESITYCEQHSVAMYLTGIRHFKH